MTETKSADPSHEDSPSQTIASTSNPPSESEALPPPFPEHLRIEAEEFARKSEAFIKSLEPLIAPYRALMDAMEKEREGFRAWRQTQTSDESSFRDIDAYKASLYTAKFEVREIPHMGHGLFATETLPAGTMILAECPLASATIAEDFLVIAYLNMFANPWNLLQDLLQKTPERQALAAQLSNAHTDKKEDLQRRLASLQKELPDTFPTTEREVLANWLGIIQTNSFSLDLRNKKMTALFPMTARINHSCTPNTTFAFEDDAIVVHAQLEIPQGTQIVTSYLQRPSLPVERRQSMLLERFGFSCRCEACMRELAQETPL